MHAWGLQLQLVLCIAIRKHMDYHAVLSGSAGEKVVCVV